MAQNNLHMALITTKNQTTGIKQLHAIIKKVLKIGSICKAFLDLFSPASQNANQACMKRELKIRPFKRMLKVAVAIALPSCTLKS